MNSDDFEKRLERQSIRPIPGEWRRDILQQANAASPSPLKIHRVLQVAQTLWRELIWPCRHAWAGMAALWLVLWGINAGLSSGEKPELATNSTEIPAVRQAMEEQRRLLAELVPPASKPPAEPPRRTQPQPRSERHVEMMAA